MRWIVDTSAWSRRGQQRVADQLREVVEGGSELALSPQVLIEVLRGPQGDDVAVERARMNEALPILPITAESFGLAVDAMEVLARHGAESHRVPITDLLTAVIAHEHGAGVLHCDGHYALLSTHAGLSFPQKQLEFESDAASDHPAARQRELRRQLNQALHRLSIEDAEALLGKWLAQARSRGPE
ncbi:MAG: PIN domain nuclease [Hyphomicrobiaceae bacterium]|nr:MAG: PIN domain nuclease [Hyphomicrobiaceae bacterium]